MDFDAALRRVVSEFTSAVAERREMMTLRALVEMWPSLNVELRRDMNEGNLWMLRSRHITIAYVWDGFGREGKPELRYQWVGDIIPKFS